MRSKSITFLSPFDQLRSRLGDYWTLCKPRLLGMVVLSACHPCGDALFGNQNAP